MGSEWREVQIGDLVAGGALAVNDGYRVRNEELGPVGIPFVRGGDIRDGIIETTVADHIRPEFESRVGVKLARPGDVAFISKGTVGRVGRMRAGQPRVVFAPQVSYYRVLNPMVIDAGFLYYSMCGADFQASLYGVMTHGSMVADYVSLSQQLDFTMRLPDVGTQRRIAGILGALDDKIELNRRMSQTLESMARALFKSWFVDFDPVRAKAEGHEPEFPSPLTNLMPSSFAYSELGEIPSGWRVCGLDEIADFLNGLALQRFPVNNGRALPAIKIAQLQAGNAYGADQVSADIPCDYVIQDGDVLFSWSGSLAVELWCGGPGALNQHLFKVTSRHFPRWFYYEWTCRHLADFRDIAAGKATTMGHIQREHLAAARVVVPSLATLDQASRYFEPLTGALVSLSLESRSLAVARDSLLPRLLSVGFPTRSRSGALPT
jgi:type I restriction enzyme S subunit